MLSALAGWTGLAVGQAPAGAALDAIRRLIDDGAYSAAADAAREAAKHIDRNASPAMGSTALALWVEASIELGKGSDDECLARAVEAVSLSEREGPGPAEQATALSTLASVRLERGEVAEARPLSEKALEIRRRLLGDEDPETAKSFELLAGVFVDEGHLAEARPLCERALRVYEAKLGPAHRVTAAALNQLGAVLRRQGEYASAQSMVERGLAIRRRVLPPMHPEIGASLNTLATVLFDKGQYREALAHYEEALEIRERTFGDEHPLVAQVLNNIGAVRTRLGDLSGALLLYERALLLREKALGSEHPDIAPNLNTVAATRFALGDFTGARRLYVRAIEIRERRLGPDHPDLATSLNNLAALLHATGDFVEAEPLFQRALAIREKRLGPAHPLVAQSLQNLARLYQDQGRLRDAAGPLERSLEIREKAFGAGNAQVALSLSSLASLRRAEGNRHEAWRLETRSLEIRRAALGPDHPDVSGSYLMLGTLSLEAGDAAGARAALAQALEIRERALGEGHPQVAPPLVGLAAALARFGEPEAAMDAALRAEDVSRRHLAVTARSLPERQALRYATTRASGLDWALSLAARQATPSSVERAWDALLRSRALVLDEMAARLRTLAGRDAPEVAPLLLAWQSARERYATLALRGPGAEIVGRYRALLDETRRESEAAERALAEASTVFRADRDRARLGLAEIRSALPPRAALVAFARFRDRARPDALSPPGKTGEIAEEYLALVAIDQASAPRLVRLGDADGIDALVRRWRTSVASGTTEGELNRIGALLRRRVWDPVAAILGAPEIVLLVPDGALSLLSFGALPVADGRYLVEAGPTLHLLSAERDLAQPVRQRATQAALTIGGVDFDAGSGPRVRPRAGVSCSDLGGVTFSDLPGTRREIEDLRLLWQSSGRSELVELGAGRATESAFRKAVAGKSLVHLATHGFFLGGSCSAARTGSRGIGGVSALQDARPPSIVDSPLLLSGLAFAGANRRGTLAEDNGVLTASEVAALDLSSVEWAVLSACDTGLGEISASEGVLGLRRAFQVAGARSIIMSLWSVDDASTREWMRFFYENLLLRGRTTAEAMREAALRALHARRARGESASPFFWAAFIAAGEWR